MSKHSKAIEDVRFIANRFQGFLALADALQSLDSIENAAAEASVRLKATQDQIAAKSSELTAQIEAAHREAEKIVTKANNDAANIKFTADENAEKVIAAANKTKIDAHAYAAGIRTGADAHRRTKESEAKGIVDKAAVDAKALVDGVEQHKSTLASLHVDITKARQELASITAQVEQAKADRQTVQESISVLHKQLSGA